LRPENLFLSLKEAHNRCLEIEVGYSKDVEHFFDSIHHFVGDFQVRAEDILKMKILYKGVVQLDFKLDNYTIQLVDTRWQRGERKKWIHSFDCVSGLVFLVSLDEFDVFIDEDDNRNVMIQTLMTFNDLINSIWFYDTPCIVVFTGKVSFEEKIKRGVSLQRCFPDYSGNSLDDACFFVRDKFESKNITGRPFCSHFIELNRDDLLDVVNSLMKSIIDWFQILNF